MQTATTDADYVREYRVLDEELTHACERSLRVYMREAWRHFDPAPFRPNWHIDLMCDVLQAVTYGHLQNVVFNVPPRHTKTATVSIVWPTWEWGPANRPSRRGLYTSYGAARAIDAAVKSRRLMQSAFFQKRWGTRFRFSTDQNIKSRYENDRGGYRISSSFESGITGEGGDLFCVDDPLQLDDGDNVVKIDHVNDQWDGTISSRLNDPATANRVIVMQRLNEKDLSGYVLDQARRLYDQAWTHVMLPAEYEPSRKCRVFLHHKLFVEDPRTKDGELLNPVRFSAAAMADLRVQNGTYRYAGRYQQRPAPAAGGIFQRAWFRYWTVLPPRMDEWLQSWDMTFGSKGEDASLVCGELWGKLGAFRYLVDGVADKMTFPETLAAVELFSAKHPIARLKLVERKANGQATIDMLQNRIGGFVPVEVTEDKPARARAVSPDVESGCVFVPHPSISQIGSELVEEAVMYPRGKTTDRTDAMTQALKRWTGGGSGVVAGVIRAGQR